MNYQTLIQNQIRHVYQAGIASKILQHMDRIRNVSDLSQSRRWVMELLQNARDTAYDGQNVHIRITLDENKVTFQHNGRPFRVKDILSIINQVSSKQGDESTVGRFGTGFMTTFQLSEIVTIDSVLRDQNPDNGEMMPYRHFSVNLDRRGQDNQEILTAIEQSILQLKECEQEEPVEDFDPSAYNTCFTYHLKTEENQRSAQTGVEDLKENILYILLNSKKLEQVEIIIGGTRRVFKREDERPCTEHLRILNVSETGEDGSKYHKLLYLQEEGLTLAASMDENEWFLPISSKTPKIFVDFPLIGAEEFPFPIVMNHRGLRPNEPRSGITLVDNVTSSDAENNKHIIDQAVYYYGIYLQESLNKGFRGVDHILSIPEYQQNREHSESWVKTHIYEAVYQKIADLPVIETECGMCKLNDHSVYLIDEDTVQARQRTFELCEPLKDYCLPKAELPWVEILKGYGIADERFISTGRLLSRAEELIVKHLDETVNSSMEWCGRLYRSAMEEPELKMRVESGQIRLFPSQKKEELSPFRLYTIRELKRDPGIPEILKDVSETLEELNTVQNEPINLRANLLALEFEPQEIPQMEVYEQTKLWNFIILRTNRQLRVSNFNLHERRYLSAWTQSWKKMISCSPDKSLYDLYQRIPDHNLPPYQSLEYACEPSLWKNTYVGIVNLIIKDITSCKTLDQLQAHLNFSNADELFVWLNAVLENAARYVNDFENHPIFPNQKGILIDNSRSIFWNEKNRKKDCTEDDSLKLVASKFTDRDESCDVASVTFDRRLAASNLRCETLTDEYLASKITNVINLLLQKTNLYDTKTEHQEGCAMLMTWLMQHPERAELLFPQYQKQENRMKLLTPKEAVRMNEKAQKLEKLMQEADVDSMEELHNLVIQGKQQKRDDQQGLDDLLGTEYDGIGYEEKKRYLKEIGLAGEHYVFQWLKEDYEKQGFELVSETNSLIRLNNHRMEVVMEYPDNESYHQQGWDIRVTCTDTTSGEQTVEYIEVKTRTTTSLYRNQLKLSASQMEKAISEGGQYRIAKVVYSKANNGCIGVYWYRDIMRCMKEKTLVGQNLEYYFYCPH